MNDRLISADAFQRTASERNWDGKITDYQLALVNYLLSIQPTVDAVPVVRCKDCKHNPTDPMGDWPRHGLEFPDDICPAQCDDYWYSWKPQDNFYCAFGERKDNEETKADKR